MAQNRAIAFAVVTASLRVDHQKILKVSKTIVPGS
jgi:hypothetical protein